MDEFQVKKGVNKFYIGESNDNFIAHITWVHEKENVIAVDHTFVSPELRGKQIASKLLAEVVKMAREDDLKVRLTFEDGKVAVKPFNVKYKDIDIEVSGKHGFDQSLDYDLALDVPAKYL